MKKITGCDAVKIESNKKNFHIISELVKSNIPVMGHIGYTPQFNKKFRIEGSSNSETKKLWKKLLRSKSRCIFHSTWMYCFTASKLITEKVKIPTIGIGSSSYCDGQILVTDDMLGLSGFYPKFVKKYAQLNRVIEKAIKKYTKEVKLKNFQLIKISLMSESLEKKI